MGRLQATEMARLAKLDVALRWHLRANHYPPVHLDFLPVAKRAIKEGKKENWDKKIKMPNGITKTVAGIIEGLHLEPFLET